MTIFGKALLAIASAGLAILSLSYGTFAPGAETLPSWVPFPAACVQAAAVLVLLASIAILIPRTATAGLLVIAAYEALWVALTLPKVLTNAPSFDTWYPLCEGLCTLAGPVILYFILQGQSQPAATRALRAAQVIFGLTCIFYGASHFAYAEYTAAMVPTWLPPPLTIAYITGACHIAAGIGIITGVLAWWAAFLEMIMMALFGLLVWAPSFFADPTPKWARSPHTQWSEVAVNLVLVASAWWVAASLKKSNSK